MVREGEGKKLLPERGEEVPVKWNPLCYKPLNRCLIPPALVDIY
jgi:hypothetical protein